MHACVGVHIKTDVCVSAATYFWLINSENYKNGIRPQWEHLVTY